MWRQLTQRARKAIFLAHEEAERLGYNRVGSEHLLLGLIRDEDCVASRMIERTGVDLGTVRVEIMKRLAKGSESLGEMQLTPDAKHAIDFAFNEVKRLSEDWVGTEHLLLGLMHDAGGLASSVLMDLGIDLFQCRSQLMQMKAGTLPFERACNSIPVSAL